MSSLGDARARIIGALEAAELRTTTTESFAAPVVMVKPGEPWTAMQRMPGRTSRWTLMLIAGRTDTEGAFGILCELIDQIDAALRGVDGIGTATWARPTVTRPAAPEAPQYDICVATVEVGLP